MLTHYLSMATELVLGFLSLLLFIKVSGKTQLSQITPFNFISALILGELLGNAIYDPEVKLVDILFATTLWGGLIFSTEKITQKFRSTRKFLEGEPTIVINKGVIKYGALKNSMMDINQLQSLLRQQGFFSLDEVEFAVLEPNGTVSVLPKAAHDLPKKKDFKMPSDPVEIPVTVIIDGEVVRDNLKDAGLNEDWLKAELAKHKVKDYKEVFYAEWRKGHRLHIMKFEE